MLVTFSPSSFDGSSSVATSESSSSPPNLNSAFFWFKDFYLLFLNTRNMEEVSKCRHSTRNVKTNNLICNMPILSLILTMMNFNLLSAWLVVAAIIDDYVGKKWYHCFSLIETFLLRYYMTIFWVFWGMAIYSSLIN